MPAERSTKLASPASSSIDAIVETPVTKLAEALRPIAHLRPSWIGPKAATRRATPQGVAMTVPVTIDFTSPGLRPPVYIATSLSDPPWEPLEMEGTQAASGEHKFSKTFHAQEGEYQYKLRLGPGDWWVCDEHKPQVDDGLGNKNNLVTVKGGESQHDRADSVHDHGAPLMPHESHNSPEQPSPFLQSEGKGAPTTPGVEHQAPLFGHESLASETSHDEHGEDVNKAHSPLLQHESAAPSQEAVSPLFRHESVAIDNQKHQDHSNRSPLLRGRKHSGDSIPEEADPNEPGLEQFPTDHRGILESIARTKTSLAEDETSDMTESPSPPQVPAKPSPSLPSLVEDEEEADLEHAKNEPQVKISEADNRPAAPITPPMTPTIERQVDPIAQRVQEKAQNAKESAKSVAEQAAREVGNANYAAVLTRSMFAFAVALTAVGIWFFAESGKNLDIIEA